MSWRSFPKPTKHCQEDFRDQKLNVLIVPMVEPSLYPGSNHLRRHLDLSAGLSLAL